MEMKTRDHKSLTGDSEPRAWLRSRCTTKLLRRRLPILVWLPAYCVDDLKGDLIAGITVALTVIPQGLALASLANLPPQYGLYTAFMGCFVYAVFGSCKNLTIGPTAIMSIMTGEHSAQGGATYVLLLTFLSGCIQLLMGLLNLGFLVTFISSSVVSGFTSAAAITIATTQIAGIFGIKSESDGFISDVKTFFRGVVNNDIEYGDMAMGLSSIVFLLMLKYCTKLKLSCCYGYAAKMLEILLQLMSTARNAMLVLLCSCVAALLQAYGYTRTLSLTERVEPGLPPFRPPEFSYTAFDNATNTTLHKGFVDIVQDLGSGLLIIPLLSLLEAIAIAKSFSKGKKIDATQEMIAIGICNILGSFVSSYPTTGSFSRTAINYSSGVRTTAGGIVTGCLVLLALGVMSPYFRYIPKAALSALIFISVLNMVHGRDLLLMWRTGRWDLLPFGVTFVLSFLLGLEYGIMLGIAISILLLLVQSTKPKISTETRQTFLGCCYLFVRPDRSILFPSAERLQSTILKEVLDKTEKTHFVILDGAYVASADYTAAMCVKGLSESLKVEDTNIIFINMNPDVEGSLRRSGMEDYTYFQNIEEAENYIDVVSVAPSAPPPYATRRSLRSDDISFNGT